MLCLQTNTILGGPLAATRCRPADNGPTGGPTGPLK